MEELERKEDQDKHVPKFVYSTVSSLCSHQNTMTVSNSNLYTSKINEAQVCVGESCFSKPESTACKTEEIRDNSKKVEKLQEEDDQDIYVPRFFIPPITTLSISHAVDKDLEYAKIESVNEAQVCVDDSFLSRSETLDSESKVMGDMEIKRSVAPSKKCDADKDAFGTSDGLKKSECFTMTERVAVTESMERTNEISVMGSSFQSSSPHIKNRRRSACSKQTYQIHDKTTGSEGTFDTIRVRLKQPLTQDTLENYFENKRKSGGGDIDSLKIIKGTAMEVEEVLITFSESKDAMNCLQQQHIIDKKTLNVQKYDQNDPSLWEIDKVLVTGMNPVTTEDTLMIFLELAAGVELIDLVRGAQEDAAIIVFAEKPDFAKMSKRCKEKKLEGNTLFVQMVEKCQTIYVKGIDKSITHDLVENFFCNKRKSGGGDVEKVDYHPEDGYCIVYFENPSDAINAAAIGKFTVNDREIQAQMYFPCLGLPEQPMNWDDMPCVSYEIKEFVIKFVKNCPKECSQIEEALQKKFVKVEWPKSKSDFIVKLQCTVTKDVGNANEILKSWKEEAEAEMYRHMKKYVCQKHSTVPEVWPAFLAQLKAVNIDRPDRVAAFLDKKNHTVIVAGYEENSEALTRIILYLIQTEELKIQNQTEKIMKIIPLDFHKCQQLWKTHFGKKLANDFPHLDFQVKINKKEVNLTGKPTEVNEALIKMHEYLMNTKAKSLNISKGRYEIFMKKEVKESFIAEMKAKGNKAVWNVIKDKVEMTSSNSRMVDEALEIFKEFIPEKRIQMKDLVKVMTKHDWQACVKELRDKHDEKLNISSSSSEVCVTATRDIFENVCKQIEYVLKICSEKCHIDRIVVNLSQQQFSYIKYFGQYKIGQITNACTSKELEIKQNESDCSIEITGNDEDVKKAFENLIRFIKKLREDSCSINKPGAKVFFNSSKGREAMKNVGKDTSCIILNKEGLQHIKENGESGHRRTPYSLPIKIAECELQFYDKKIIVMKGDVTKLKVDVIVNDANRDLDHCGGFALAISKAEESHTYIASEGIVRNGDIVLAEPGELPCKLLLHTVGPKWCGGSCDAELLLKKAIFKCLDLTDKYKYFSIAIPAFSAGILGYPVAKSVEAVLDAIQSYIKTTSSSIKEIYFCDENDDIVKEFIKCLKKNFGLEVKEFNGNEQDAVYGDDDDISRGGPQYQRHQSGNRGSRVHMQQPVEENVTFLILSSSKKNIRKAKKSLDDVYKCTDIDASKQKLNDRQIDAIKRIAKGIDCLFTESKILLMGPANEVNEATVDILKYLHEVKDKEKAEAIQMYVKWQYEVSPEKWMTFRDEINMEIETAYKEKKNSCVVKDRTGTEYVIDFKKMEEYEKSNYKKKYKIIRKDKAGSTSVGLPSNWAHMKSDQTMVEVKLSPHDREYKDVVARFNATSGGSVSISEIRRVQNPSLYQQYAAKRKEISIRNRKNPEQWLWHGTYPDTVKKIINNGFNRSYCGKHGTSCGAGVYFAVNASYSLGYCSADSNGCKHMFSVQVATGDACQGNSSLLVLPPKPGAGGHVTYDSASDNPSNPVMFVIFHDSQAYPAYHIIFR